MEKSKILEKAKMEYALGCSYLEEENYPKAQKYFESAIQLDPLYKSAWNNLGVSYFSANQFSGAEFCFSQALALDPTNQAALLNICKTLLALKKLPLLSEKLVFFQDKYPDNPEIPHIRVLFYELNEDFETAVIFLQNYLTGHPHEKEFYFHLANFLEKSNNIPEAIKTLETAYRQFPSNTTLLNDLGLLYESVEDFSKAESMYQQALDVTPKDALLWGNLGNLYQEMDRTEEAIKVYRKALEINSEESEILNNWCDLHLQLNRIADIAPEIEKLEKINPENVFILDTLYQYYRQMGNVQKADSFKKTILKQDPTFFH
ncbi:MAG: tetratricopeptide repeat protein [Promethearchaeota archaeon]